MADNKYFKKPRKSEPIKNAGQQLRRTKTSNIDVSVDKNFRRPAIRRSRMSTPSTRDRSSLRFQRSIASASNMSETSMSDTSDCGDSVSLSRYYSTREIKKAKKRIEQYKLKSDPKVSEQLLRECDKDKRRYIEKIKSRDPTRTEEEFETRLEELLRRQRDIDRGKASDVYQQYVNTIAKVDRELHHPRTPNKFRKVSRRAWDGMVKKWRLTLHSYEELNPDEPYKTDASIVEDGDEESDEVFASPWNVIRQPIETEEDTLQAEKKEPSSAVAANDDETLDACESQINLRSKRVLSPLNRCTLTPDELHSGLTNDLNAVEVENKSRNGKLKLSAL